MLATQRVILENYIKLFLPVKSFLPGLLHSTIDLAHPLAPFIFTQSNTMNVRSIAVLICSCSFSSQLAGLAHPDLGLPLLSVNLDGSQMTIKSIKPSLFRSLNVEVILSQQVAIDTNQMTMPSKTSSNFSTISAMPYLLQCNISLLMRGSVHSLW